jgi:hypothetical protein
MHTVVVSVLLAPGHAISKESGRVVTGNVTDERGRPERVKLAIDSGPFRWLSDANGKFTIPDVPLDAKYLVCDAPGVGIGSWDLPVDGTPMTVIIYRHPGIAVKVVDATGRLIRGVPLYAQRLNSSEPPEELSDGVEGGNVMVGLPRGRYRIWAKFHPSIEGQTITVDPFKPIRLTLRQRKGAILRVRIVDKGGERLESDALLAPGDLSRRKNWNDAKGLSYSDSVSNAKGATFAGLEPGLYTVILPVPDCGQNVTLKKPVSVPRGTTAITIQLPYVYEECP